MDSCNYKTLQRTGKLDLNHANVIRNSIGPGFDLRKTNSNKGGFSTLGKAYRNNGNACGSGKFLTKLCGMK